jgi:hypothetical protein
MNVAFFAVMVVVSLALGWATLVGGDAPQGEPSTG